MARWAFVQGILSKFCEFCVQPALEVGSHGKLLASCLGYFFSRDWLLGRNSLCNRCCQGPRREDDSVAQKFQLGPLRTEAFVRRPDEKMQSEVYKAMGWENNEIG